MGGLPASDVQNSLQLLYRLNFWSTEGAPRVSEAVRVEMPGDALLLVNERGEMVSRARDAVFPEGSNLEEANAALLRRMVEGKKLAVVEVVKGGFASLVDAEDSKTALDRSHAQQLNAATVCTYKAQFAAYLDQWSRWRTRADKKSVAALLPEPKPPARPRLLKVAPDCLVTLRLQLLPGLARRGVFHLKDPSRARSSHGAADAELGQCGSDVLHGGGTHNEAGRHAVGEEGGDSEDGEDDEDPTAAPGSPDAGAAAANGVSGEDSLGPDGVPGHPLRPSAVLEALHPGGNDAAGKQRRLDPQWGDAAAVVHELVNAGALVDPAAINQVLEGKGSTAPQRRDTARKEIPRLRQKVLRMAEPHDWEESASHPPGLLTPLFPYQRRALAWLLWREGCGTASQPALERAITEAHRHAAARATGSSIASAAPHVNGNLLRSSARAAEKLNPSEGSGADRAERAATAQAVDGRNGSELIKLEAAASSPWTSLASHLEGTTRSLGGGTTKKPRLWFNWQTGSMTYREPKDTAYSGVPGGILCEEMGLGKTMEMLALVLARPRPRLPDAPQVLQALHQSPPSQALPPESTKPHSSVHPSAPSSDRPPPEEQMLGLYDRPPELVSPPKPKGFLSSGWGGTLIVSPTAIHAQWLSEIKKHTTLKVEVYYGLVWHRNNELEGEKRGKTKKDKPSFQDQWETLRNVAAGHSVLAFQADEEVDAVVKRLMEADIILTTYQVLQGEVNYNDPVRGAVGESTRVLRHPKKYKVPVSPLLAVAWWRVAFDEAQMVSSGISAVSVMAKRIMAAHRWAVTGTPLTSGHGIRELPKILQVVDAQRWTENDFFRWKGIVQNSLADGHLAPLTAAVRPLMWRNTKAIVSREGAVLPPRTLKEVFLHFTPGEAAFYAEIRDDGRMARAHLQEMLSNPVNSRAYYASVKRAQSAAEKEAKEVMLQLRMSCLHPQMTAYWRRLSAEMQLDDGGTLSMGEIMTRMSDAKQVALQKQERELCDHLNALAACLSAAADDYEDVSAAPSSPRAARTSPGQGRPQNPSKREGTADPTQSEEPVTPRGRDTPQMRRSRKRKASGSETPATPKKRRLNSDADVAAARLEALQALLAARRVTEKGVEAFPPDTDLQSLPEPQAAASASIATWREIEVNTALQLQAAHSRAGDDAAATAAGALYDRKRADITEAADVKLAAARSRLDQREWMLVGARRAVDATWLQADGVVPSQLLCDIGASEWLSATADAFEAAQEAERAARSEVVLQGTGETHVALLGTEVEEFVSAAMKPFEAPRAALEAAVHGLHLAAAAADAKAVWDVLTEKEALPTPVEGEVAPRAPQGMPFADYLVSLACRHELEGETGALEIAKRYRAYLPQILVDETAKSVRRQQRELSKQAAGNAATASTYCQTVGLPPEAVAQLPPEVAAAAAAAHGSRISALRAWRDLHKSQLLVEVATGEQAAAQEEAHAAATKWQGDDAWVHTPDYWRKQVAEAVDAALKLAAEKRYLQTRAADTRASEPSPMDATASLVASPSTDATDAVTATPASREEAPGAVSAAGEAPAEDAAEGVGIPPAASTPLHAAAAQAPSPSAGVSVAGERPREEAALEQALAALRTTCRGCDASTNPRPKPVEVPPDRTVQASPVQPRPPVLDCDGKPSPDKPRESSPSEAKKRQLGSVRQPAQPAKLLPSEPSTNGQGLSFTECQLAKAERNNDMKPLFMSGSTTTVKIEEVNSQSEVHSHAPAAIASQPANITESPLLTLSVSQSDSQTVGQPVRSQPPCTPAGTAAEMRAAGMAATTGVGRAVGLQTAGAVPATMEKGSAPLAGAVADDGAAVVAAGDHQEQEAAARKTVSEGVPAQTEAGLPGGSSGGAVPGEGCPICLEPLVGRALHVYMCGHTFCANCSRRTYESGVENTPRHVVCPVCKRKEKWPPYRAAAAANGGHGRAAAGGGGDAPVDSDPDDPGLSKVVLSGGWMTKLEAALRRVVRGQVTAPGEKWLVFSAFEAALQMLQKALAANGIAAVVLRGNREAMTKALVRFDGEDDVKVMLMPARTTAAGLTLTRASRIILLEPAPDPAIPQQAVARCHRTGQTRPVVVYQLIMANTIEESIWRMQQERQHLFGGDQGGSESEGGRADEGEEGNGGDALPAPLANPQALRPQDLQRLLESLIDAPSAQADDPRP